MSQVILSPNVKKESVRIDTYGNIIDPKTGEILKANVPDYVPTKEEIEAKINMPKEPPAVLPTAKSISEQIAYAERLLAELKLKKKEEITRLKQELEKLEKE